MPGDGSGGLFLLLTESFAVRAMLGSVVAIGLVYVVIRGAGVRCGRARRLLVLAPITAAVAAAIVSVGDAFLPRLWVATTQSTSAVQLLQFLGEPWFLTPQRDVDLLLLAWATVALVLLTRRLTGVLAVRRLVGKAAPPSGYGDLVPVVDRLAQGMSIRPPALLLLPQCPGGAFTARALRPVLVVDPVVVDGLDQRELEGLVAHELAHIRRRDNLLAGIIGVVRDLAFFLPPIHAAARWLRQEREESADELASEITRRPGALASSILKVWESSTASRRPVVCAAVPPRLALAGGGAVIEARVERLISIRDALPAWRRRAELGLAGIVTATAVGAAVALPAWMVTHHDAAGLAVGYLSPVESVGSVPEAPAFATFRSLAPAPAAATSVGVSRPEAGAAMTACPCVETRTQMRDRSQPAAATSGIAWKSSREDAPWELRSVRNASLSRDTRALWTVSEPGQHVGFFVLGASVEAR